MGQIKVEKNVGGIEGLCVIEPAVHGDARGYFMETYNEKDMKEAGMAWNDLEIGIKWLEMKGKYKSSDGEKATRWKVARHGT